MSPADAYRCYCAFKTHFAGKFDFFKYNGKMNIPYTTYNKRNDKKYFSVLSEREDMYMLLLANFLENRNAWIGDVISTNGNEILESYHRRLKRMTYNLKEDLIQISKSDIVSGKFFDSDINLETLCLINSLFKMTTRLKDDVNFKYTHENQFLQLERYYPFLERLTDVKKKKSLILSHYGLN